MAENGDGLGIDRYYRSFSAGSMLYDAGVPATELYLIREGRVRLFKRARGVERSLGVLGPGELFGEEALITAAHRSSSAQAIEPVTALVIDRDTFRALIRERSQIGESVMEQLALRLRRAEEQLENFMLPDPTMRVVGSLIQASDGASNGRLEVSPLELSNRTALDVDQVKAVVGQLRDRGYLEIADQAITIADPAALHRLRDLLSMKEEVEHELGCR